MFASHSSVQVHKLNKTTGRLLQFIHIHSAVHPQYSQQHQRFTRLDKFRQVQIRSWKMHDKDVRSSSATILLCRPALTDLHAWPAGFQATGAFCYWMFARQNLYFLSHKPPRLIPLCDGHLLHLLFSIIWVSWTKSIVQMLASAHAYFQRSF